jgi:hypothetical protein
MNNCLYGKESFVYVFLRCDKSGLLYVGKKVQLSFLLSRICFLLFYHPLLRVYQQIMPF